MSKIRQELAPSEIRSIRERLGLSQVEAGELIGGGPSSFTKYEAGTVKPAASVINLLRLLEANPAGIITLGGGMPRPVIAFGSGPFEVTGGHISVLRERDLPLLLRKLLSAEAQTHSLPADGIRVASNIHVPDGGEDGSITWTAGPERTSFLPSRLNQFQLKAGKISPGAAAKDVLIKGAVKDMIFSALEIGGHYIMLCAHPYSGREINHRKARIRKELRDTGMTIKDEQVDFWDAEQIATWVNSHPAVATWVKEQTHGTISPFLSWNHWAGRAEHDQSPWVEDARLSSLRDRLREIVETPRQILRLVGLSGVGKSRLVLEALRATEGEDAASTSASDLIIYAIETETSYAAINEVVQTLAVTPQRAVLVVDNCGPESHQGLSAMVLHQGSHLSLVTIDNEIPIGTLDGNTLRIEEAPPPVTEGIISHVSSGLPYEDRSRLERFSKGFPEVSVRVGKTWSESRPVAHATDDAFVDAFVLGRNPRDPELLRKSAALLAVFGLVDVGPQADSQLSEIASLGRNLSTEDLYAAVAQLVDRGVAQRRGRFVTLQPRPVAMKLAERQWKEWPASTWERVLSGDISAGLKTLAAKQLALLNTTEVSRKVVSHVCRRGGPFDCLGWTTPLACAEVWSALAEVDPEAVADQIERSLGNIEDLSEVSSDARRSLVRALEKIAFHAHTFEEGARLLLRVASDENEIVSQLPAKSDLWHLRWESGALGKFKGLFPMFLGGTAADGVARLSFLDEAAGSADPARRKIICHALISGCTIGTFERMLGPESQGSSPALVSWRPDTKEEVINYIDGCAARLAQFALNDDLAGISARSGLGNSLPILIREGFIDTAERVVAEVSAAKDYWPEAMTSVRAVIAFDAENMTPELTERVRELLKELQPRGLEARIRSTVTEMSWGDLESREPDFRLLEQCRVEAVHGLAAELLQQPPTLAASLPQLSRGPQRMAYQFGAAVADLASSPLEWLEPFIEAVVEAPEGERNHDLLSGFITHLATNHPHVVVAFKQRAARSRELASALPQIWGRSSIDASDVQLAIEALKDGVLPPLRLSEWLHAWAIAEIPAREIAPLFDTLLEHSAEGFTAAVDLMHKYAFNSPEKLDGLHPQVLRLAENSTRWQPARDWNLSQYRFEQIMDGTLRKGRQDSCASNTALALAKALANVEAFDCGFLGKTALSELLSRFPEVAWPLVGQVIVSDQSRASRLTSILGDQYAIERKPNPVILSLPESTLFAWCHAHPERAPAYTAKLVPVLTTQETAASERSLHPVMARLLNEFGDRDDVRQAIESNIRTFGWFGSRTNYYTLYKEPIGRLLQHSKPEVSRWAKTLLRQLDDAIVGANKEEEEREALGGI